MTKRKKWLLWGFVITTPLLGFLAFIGMLGFNVFHAHEHGIKPAGMAFSAYAQDHDGKLPSDTNGFGNALLLLVNYYHIPPGASPPTSGIDLPGAKRQQAP